MTTYDPRIYIRDFTETDYRLFLTEGEFDLNGANVELLRHLILHAEATVPGDTLLLSGDAQSGGDSLALSGASGVIELSAGSRFNLTGYDIQLIRGSSVSVSAGVFALVGNTINLTRQLPLNVSAGAFLLSTPNIDLRRDLILHCDAGAFDLTGYQAILLNDEVLLGALTQHYFLTGNDVQLLRGLKLSPATGGFALAGSAISLKRAVKLDPAAGVFTLVGGTANLARQLPLITAAGTFALSGQPVTLRLGLRLGVAAGSFALAGSAAGLKLASKLSGGVGSFAFAGSSIDLKRQLQLDAANGAFALAGVDAQLQRALVFHLEAGEFSLNTDGDGSDVLLLHCDGTDGATSFLDASFAGHDVSAIGDAQVDTTQSKFGGASLLLDGSDDRLTVPGSDDWHLWAGDATIDLWFRWPSVPTGETPIISQWADFDNNWYIGFIGVGLGGPEFFIQTRFGGTIQGSATADPGTLSANTWYHLAIEKAGSVTNFYLNGTKLTTVQDDAWGTQSNLSAPLYIGSRGGSSFNFPGWIDELRISKGVARYGGNSFTPETGPYGPGVGVELHRGFRLTVSTGAFSLSGPNIDLTLASPGDTLLLSGDAQSGTDGLKTSGDEQSGTDIIKLSGA